MNCRDFNTFASLYIDDMLNQEERSKFEAHLKECPYCRNNFENLKRIIEAAKEIQEIELPVNFTKELRLKIEKEVNNKKKKRFFTSWKFLSGVAAGVLVLIISYSTFYQLFFSNTKGMRSSDHGNAEIAMDQSATSEGRFSVGSNDNNFGRSEEELAVKSIPPESREYIQYNYSIIPDETSSDARESSTDFQKIIKQGRLKLEVENFDTVYGDIIRIIDENNGYIEHSEVSNRVFFREKTEDNLKYGYITIRIPGERFLGVYEQLKTLGEVIYQGTTGENITEKYMDIESEVQNLRVQEERLRVLYDRADKIEDLLKIENELSRIRNQINSLMGTLKNYDKLVTMSTIYLEIEQVKNTGAKIQSVNEGLWSKARKNFITTINQLISLFEMAVIKLFGLLPILIVVGIIGAPLGFTIYNKKRKNERKE